MDDERLHIKVRSHEARCNQDLMRIRSESNAHRMLIDRVHMAQQVSRFEVNCGERGCHKQQQKATKC